MTNVPYHTNIPFASNSPSQDQPRMQENTNSTKAIFEFDHIGFRNNQGGYHNVIHQPPQASDPALVANVGQIYTKLANGIEELFYEGGTGIINQLTGHFSAAVSGYVFIQGGILLQWGTQVGVSTGSFSSGSATGQVVYPLAFPTRCFTALTMPYYNVGLGVPSVPGTVAVDVQSITPPTLNYKTQFNWSFKSSSSNYVGFFWIAIGH